MRCKNCGSENDDNRYICQNCGSPLYDEQDFDDTTEESVAENDNMPDFGIPFETNDGLNTNTGNAQNNNAEKKSIIVIAILAVILKAIIVSIIVVAQTKSKNENDTTESTSISTTESTSKKSNGYTERTTTTTTTERTTTTTTTRPTTTTTEAVSYKIKLISEGGGTVSGSGSYGDGDNVTITANADSGYEFDGWYTNGTKISSAPSYSFTATKDMTISAKFNAITTQEVTEGEDETVDGGLN